MSRVPDPTERLLAPRRRGSRSSRSGRDSEHGHTQPGAIFEHKRAEHRRGRRRSHHAPVRWPWAVLSLIMIALACLGWWAWVYEKPLTTLASATQGEAEQHAQRVASVQAPVLVGTDMMLRAAPAKDWRTQRGVSSPGVLVLEFPDLLEQGQALNRVAALYEKANASREHLLNDEQLTALIKSKDDNTATFLLGHDYTGVQLARYFTLAASQGLALNAHEMRLRELLLATRVIERSDAKGYSSTDEQALVSFTGKQADNPATSQDETVDAKRRESVLRHELSHGQFFTRASYREHCWQFWRNALTAEDRQRFTRFLGSLDYDTSNEELMVNEMQAMLMHTPDERAFSAGLVGIPEAELNRLRTRFRQGWPD